MSNNSEREIKLQKIIDWGQNNPDIVAMLLTSSLVNPLAPIDDFSDLDIEIVFKNNNNYISDNNWLNFFGEPIATLEENEDSFNGRHAMKMVLYTDHVKVDFKLFSLDKFLQEINLSPLPEDWDIGYKVLIDKNGITKTMKPASHQVSIIKKPSLEKFQETLHSFWWDTTYVAKCLAREDIFYAKFMTENIIRTEYLVPLIEWYIASQNNWNITTNKHGRLFKKYLSPKIWKKIEETFSGYNLNENWIALFSMTDLVHDLGTNIANTFNAEYPTELEKKILQYLVEVNENSITR